MKDQNKLSHLTADSKRMKLIFGISGGGLLFVITDLLNVFPNRLGYYSGVALLVTACLFAIRRFSINLDFELK